MTSFRSDFSTNSIGSNASTRSMLSEAKAKLEALSGKMTSIKQTNYSRNFEVNNNNPSKSFYARDQLIQYFPFSSIGFKFGIQFNLKHN